MNPGPGVPVAQQRYTNWNLQHETAVLMPYARLPAVLNALTSVQYMDFHVHYQRNDARAALMAVLADAPFAERTRYPEAPWVELSAFVCGMLAAAYMGICSPCCCGFIRTGPLSSCIWGCTGEGK